MRYGDGVVKLAETDLHSDGFGFPWGQTRAWTNGPCCLRRNPGRAKTRNGCSNSSLRAWQGVG